MTRTIKFRAWEKEQKKMFWVNKLDVPNFDSGAVMLRQNLPSERDDYWQPIGDVVLMQFTGLLDKNGKEIYEGDVVKILYTDWPSCSGCHNTPQEHMDAIALTRMVIWSVRGFYVSTRVGGYAESIEPGTHGFIEVIGNIYENPELLKSND